MGDGGWSEGPSHTDKNVSRPWTQTFTFLRDIDIHESIYIIKLKYFNRRQFSENMLQDVFDMLSLLGVSIVKSITVCLHYIAVITR